MAQEIKEFLKAGAAQRLHLEQLSGYAPDLNPHRERHLPYVPRSVAIKIRSESLRNSAFSSSLLLM